jgi:hypothetical protein
MDDISRRDFVADVAKASAALPSFPAMRMGKHVYCQKPLARTIHGVRTLRKGWTV